jgi:hypothetical protein
MAYEEYQDALTEMWNAFRKFHRAYMNSLDGMIQSKGVDPILSGREAIKQRDAIADAYAGLNSAIAQHLREVNNRSLRASDKTQIARKLLKIAKALMADTYIFHEDPGHGWLEVGRDELKRLGILQKISRYSYQKGDRVFLEEDLDAGIFVKAKKKNGERVSFREVYKENTPIRRYQNFRP